MNPIDFCSECPCVAGNGQRGHHMVYVSMEPRVAGGAGAGPMACAFCKHTSLPVTAEKAFKVLPPPPVTVPGPATIQWRTPYGASFLMVDKGNLTLTAAIGNPNGGRPSASFRLMTDRGFFHISLDPDELEEFRAWIAKKPEPGPQPGSAQAEAAAVGAVAS